MVYPRIRVFRHYVSPASLLLGGIELVILLALAHLLLSSQTAAAAEGATIFSYFATAVAILSAIIFLALGLYNRQIISNVQVMMVRLLVGVSLVAALTFGLIKWYITYFPVEAYPPNHYFYLPSGILLGIAVLICTRVIFLIVADLSVFRQRIIMIGEASYVGSLSQKFVSDQAMGFDIVASIDPADLADGPPGAADCTPKINLWDRVQAEQADEVVVAAAPGDAPPAIHQLVECKLRGVRVSEYLSFVERELGRIDLDWLRPNWLVFSDGFQQSALSNAAQRTFDIIVALLLIIFTLPITVVVAILIKLESPGPVFYRQERVGLNANTFTLTKFRSMRADAETKDGPRWAGVNDDRVTEIGRFIRITRIDEIPQVFNVLRGEMSIIGPRPERPFFVEGLCQAIPFYNERHGVKPGITGWAQINYPYGASIEDAREKLAYDLYYVKNRSMFLNVIILLQTARVVLWPSGVR